MPETFTCPRCSETYQEHWRAPDSPDICRSCRKSAGCPHHPGTSPLEHSCHYAHERPGGPCRYCGEPVPMDGNPCARCWESFDGMAVADIKALFAADAENAPEGRGVFDVRVTPPEEGQADER